MKYLRYSLRGLNAVALAIALLWCVGLWCYQPISLITLCTILGAWVAVCRIRKKRPSHTSWWLWGLVTACILTYCCIPGPTPQQWQTPWAKEPQFEFSDNGHTLTIRNIRDFRYRTEDDYSPHYCTQSYDLNSITGVDFAECHWDGMEAICHTMLSFSFADGRHLVISPETRLPLGVEQNAIGGLYKRYGLLYVFGTEDDIFALRTNYRHEDLFLMPMKVSPSQARTMLLYLVAQQMHAAASHLPYNTVSHNCSTGIIRMFRHVAPSMPLIYNLLPIHNGSISRILFRHGAFHSLPHESYEDFRARSYLGYDLPSDNFSSVIRSRIAPAPSAP